MTPPRNKELYSWNPHDVIELQNSHNITFFLPAALHKLHWRGHAHERIDPNGCVKTGSSKKPWIQSKVLPLNGHEGQDAQESLQT
ncbi:hypothetical protein ILYODFUR_031986 [Ilyodon furcidens]|uniref:Uncharacterized protein n=1 Tax=Ilyodon furcidens TaxID=33524 RepID=A0ABV0VIV1_9TELE